MGVGGWEWEVAIDFTLTDNNVLREYQFACLFGFVLFFFFRALVLY